ncbi:MAG: hypothetical protein KAV41_02510 [Candidatus Pacebacteria bacterium]|nr:hypothetical protein [Candidatus Paceibacterota bacterium]
MVIKKTKKVKKSTGEIIPKPSKIKEVAPLEKLLQKSDVLLMLYSKNKKGYFYYSIEPEDEITVYELLKENKTEKKSLLILLDTSGGNVYSATKIMDTLRCFYDNITIAIPQEAKSSGTMMCCGADKLIMSSISELGPLDKPMAHPDDETAQISALDIVKSIDGMINMAMNKQKEFAKDLKSENSLTPQKSLEIAGNSVSQLISPMLCREDVKIYNQAKRLLAIAETYGSEFLKDNMLKYIKNDKLRDKISHMTIRQLVWLYPDHAFAIRRKELRDWFFIIEDAEKVDYWDELWKEYKKTIGSSGKVIKFI